MTTCRETLGELILRRKNELGLSFRQMGQRAVDAGLATSQPNWDHLTKPMDEFPKVRTIHALSVALEVTPWEIVEAASETLGFAPIRVTSLDQLDEQWMVVSTDDLSAEEQDILRKKIVEATAELRGNKIE